MLVESEHVVCAFGCLLLPWYAAIAMERMPCALHQLNCEGEFRKEAASCVVCDILNGLVTCTIHASRTEISTPITL